MRRALAAAAAAAALLAGCGGASGPAPTARRPPPALRRLVVGRGATAAVVLRPAGGPARRPGVLFLHGWGAVDPATYGPWLRHLAAEGNAVIYPRYQLSALSPPSCAFGAMVAGVRAALARVPIAPGSLVVAGHSAGGALAADYAASARALGLPPARAVFAVYPGRSLRGLPFTLPVRGGGAIPPATRVVALAGARDAIVGSTTARAIAAARVRRRRLVVVRDPAAADHLAPQRAGVASRRAFWAPLDALIRRARASG